MYVHVQILPGNTHAFLYTPKPIKKATLLHTLYLYTPSLPAPPEVLKLFLLSPRLRVQLQNLTYKYGLQDIFSSQVYPAALTLGQHKTEEPDNRK